MTRHAPRSCLALALFISACATEPDPIEPITATAAEPVPDDAALVAIAKAYFLGENALAVDTTMTPAIAAGIRVAVSPDFLAVRNDRMAARTQQRDLDALAGVRFSSVATEVTAVGPARVEPGLIRLRVEEHTDYSFADGDADPYSYQVQHELVFANIGTSWTLAGIETDDPSGLTVPVKLDDAALAEARSVVMSGNAARAAGPPAKALATFAYDYQAMATWAAYYSIHAVNYTRDTNDCTTFVSFALNHGGWSEVSGYYTHDGSWWYNCDWCLPRHSYPWGGAVNWQRFAYNVFHRVSTLSSVWSVGLADVVQFGGATPGHTMMVTAFSGTMPLLSYHTTDTRNKPLNQILAVTVGKTYWAFRT